MLRIIVLLCSILFSTNALAVDGYMAASVAAIAATSAVTSASDTCTNCENYNLYVKQSCARYTLDLLGSASKRFLPETRQKYEPVLAEMQEQVKQLSGFILPVKISLPDSNGDSRLDVAFHNVLLMYQKFITLETPRAACKADTDKKLLDLARDLYDTDVVLAKIVDYDMPDFRQFIIENGGDLRMKFLGNMLLFLIGTIAVVVGISALRNIFS